MGSDAVVWAQRGQHVNEWTGLCARKLYLCILKFGFHRILMYHEISFCF